MDEDNDVVARLLLRANVRAQVEACRNCSLHSVSCGPIPFRGPSPARIAVIGEAPGKVEDAVRKPFVGPSGQLAQDRLRHAGIDPDSVAWVNVVSCFPNRTPTQREVTACKGNLERQLAVIRPSACLLFGGVAVSAWWPNIRMGDIRGQFWQGTVAGLDYTPWMMATWHPAAVLRNGIGSSRDQEMVSDIASFRGLSDTTRVTGVSPAPSDPLYLSLWLKVHSDKCWECGGIAVVWVDCEGRYLPWGIGGLGYCRKHDDKRKGIVGKGRSSSPRAKPSSALSRKKVKDAPVQGEFL